MNIKKQKLFLLLLSFESCSLLASALVSAKQNAKSKQGKEIARPKQSDDALLEAILKNPEHQAARAKQAAKNLEQFKQQQISKELINDLGLLNNSLKKIITTKKNYRGQSVIDPTLVHEAKEIIVKMEEKGDFRQDLFMASILIGDLELCKLFLDKKIDVNFQNQNGFNALMIAIEEGRKPIVELLLNYGANPNLQNKDGNTALMFATMSIQDNSANLVKELLKAKANPNVQNKKGNTALLLTAMSTHKNAPTIAKELLKANANQDLQNNQENTALIAAIDHNNIAVAQVLMDAGFETESKEDDAALSLAALLPKNRNRQATIVKKKNENLDQSDNGFSEEDINQLDVLTQTLKDIITAKKNSYRQKFIDHALLNEAKNIISNIEDRETLRKFAYGDLFMASILIGDLELCKLFLDKKIDVNFQNQNGYNALMIAIEEGKKPIVELLLNSGANPNLQNKDGNTALMFATMSIQENSTNLVKDLLKAKANPEVQNKKGNTALLIAAMSRHKNAPAIARELLKAKANPNAQNTHGQTALMLAAMLNHENNLAITKELLNAHANPNLQNVNGQTALLFAIKFNHENNLTIVKELLKSKANPNLQNKNKDTALMLAAILNHENNLSIVKELLNANANPDLQNIYSQTALMFVAMLNHENNLAIAKELLNAHANPNLQNRDKETALMLACQAQNPQADLVQMLIDAGTDLNVQNDQGDTALSLTISDSMIRKMLLDANANPNIANNEGYTPLMHAIRENKASENNNEIELTLEQLFAHQVNLNAQDNNGNSALMIAIEVENEYVVKRLLQAGADPLLQNNEKLNAVDYANSFNYKNLAEIIEKSLKTKEKENA